MWRLLCMRAKCHSTVLLLCCTMNGISCKNVISQFARRTHTEESFSEDDVSCLNTLRWASVSFSMWFRNSSHLLFVGIYRQQLILNSSINGLHSVNITQRAIEMYQINLIKSQVGLKLAGIALHRYIRQANSLTELLFTAISTTYQMDQQFQRGSANNFRYSVWQRNFILCRGQST